MQLNDPLDAIAVRVLGSLIEKQVTTPANYPLTLKSLVTACNQTSNRDPVLTIDDAAALDTLKDLSRRSLAREVHRSDMRAKRYRHLMEETVHLHPPELAVMCVLMLRGEQTAGEIRSRTTRLFEFRDLDHVGVTLRGLATLEPPLVAELPVQPGRKEARFVHLLSGPPQTDGADAHPLTHHDAGTADSEHLDKGAGTDRLAAFEQALASLRSEMAELRKQFEDFRRQFQ